MLDWLIIGGGPHGAHMAIRLLDRGVRTNRITILDPNPLPLARWKHHTENTGMTHLRSPEIHNIGVDPFSLGRHSATYEFVNAIHHDELEKGTSLNSEFIPPYSRPSLRLFMHHSQSTIEKTGLMRRWRQGRAEHLRNTEAGYQVQTQSGERIETRNVVLALGMGDQTNLPPWATRLKTRTRVFHIFDPDFNRDHINQNHDVVIVGAGISAAQLALSLLETNPKRRISIISRHFLRKEDFDSDPGWLGPKLLKGFHHESDYAMRRAMIREARNKGSLASEVMDALQVAMLKDRTISLELAEIKNASDDSIGNRIELQVRPFELDEPRYRKTGAVEFKFSENIQTLEADSVVLATGFEAKRPGGVFIDDAIKRMSLPTADDGFPIVNRYLEWRKGLFVMGALAELEVGPASRNISGARMAAEKILGRSEANDSAKAPLPFQNYGTGKTKKQEAFGSNPAKKFAME
ncbi:MAG: FAD/NAD(P)-binding protein [Verrucomicrobiota bacterium]